MDLFQLVAKLGMDTSEYDKGVKASKSSISDLAEHVSAKTIAMGNLIASGIKKAIDVIGDLGKTAVTNAAGIAAETAQFEASFGELQSAAHGVFSSIGEDTGILSTRLQNVGTKAFSQFKGAGLDAVTALSSMDKYTRLAADAAAYYDLSLEDADQLMRSFIRGNTSAGDSIGLFTSETQRNSKAMEVYGAKWTELTEAQKQMLMLNIAEEIYTQSGAIGQASREADGWTNVVGNLQEAWRQFTGLIGTPLQEGLTPVIQKLSEFLSDGTVQLRFALLAQRIGSIAGYVFDGVIELIDSLLKWSTGEEENGTISAIVSIAAALKEIAGLVFDGAMVLINALFNGLDETTATNVQEFLEDFGSFAGDENVKGLSAVLLGIAAAWLLMHAPMVLIAVAIGVIVTHWKDIKEWAGKAYDAVTAFFTVTIPEGFMSTVGPIFEKIAGWVSSAKDGLSNFFLIAMPEGFMDATNSVFSVISSIIDGMETALTSFFGMFMPEGFMDGLKDIFTTIRGILTNMQTKLNNFFGTKMPEGFGSAIESVLNTITGIIGTIQSAWNTFIDSIATAKQGIAEVQSSMNSGGIWSGVKSAVSNAWWNPTNWGSGSGGSSSSFGGGSSSGTGAGKSFATGLDYVPYNDYYARLHEGEAVLTKAEASDWRRGTGNAQVDAASIASAVASAVREALSGAAVTMDGQRVGNLVTETVSRNIANTAYRGRYAT